MPHISYNIFYIEGIETIDRERCGENMGEANSIQEQVYATLRKNILNMYLEPGTTMSTQELADRLEVSRTPVREALIRLQRDGLVKMLPQRETVVSKIDMERVIQERYMRKSLETPALRICMERKDETVFREMERSIAVQRELCGNQQYDELLACDDEFHRLLFQGAGQDLSWEVLSQMNTHYSRMRLLSLKNKDIMGNVVCQHEALLKAIRDGQLEAAEELLDRHIRKLDKEEGLLRETYPDFFVDQSKKNGVIEL